MVDLQSFDAVYYWTYDTIAAHKAMEDGQDLWLQDALDRPAISESSISFDAPASWEWGEEPIKFLREDDGLWRATPEEGYYYEAVRSDTPSSVILTGTWKEPGYRGAFIAVLPKQGVNP